MKRLLLLSLFSIFSIICFPQKNNYINYAFRNNRIAILWQEMQSYYKAICNNDQIVNQEQQYCTPQWSSCKQPLQDYLQGQPRSNFIDFKIPGLSWIGHTVFDALGEYQIVYLQSCISENTKKLLHRFSDHPLVGYPFNVKEFNCSTHTLIHLYYIAQVIEHTKGKDIQTIVEIGGGYGNLMRLIKQILPNTTCIMFDLTEIAAIQWLYLKSTTPGVPVYFHTSVPQLFEDGAIHILPIGLLNQASIKTDVFISTFALSESSEQLQKKVIELSFFNARTCYLSGQVDGWKNHKGSNYQYVNHSLIHDALRNQYQETVCTPYPNSTRAAASYEILAFNYQ